MEVLSTLWCHDRIHVGEQCYPFENQSQLNDCEEEVCLYVPVHQKKHYVMRSAKSYSKSENLFLRKSNLKLLGLKIPILSFEWKCVKVVPNNIFVKILD